MGEAAGLFRAIGDQWRDAKQAAAVVAKYMAPQRYMDVTGYAATSGEHAMKGAPPGYKSITFNNQSVYPVAQIRFGTGSLIGYRPWHSGSHIHIMAAIEPPGPDAKPVHS